MAYVLILEDDETFGKLLQESLEEAGHTAATFANATTAYASVCEQAPDVVVTDLIVLEQNKPVPDGGLSLISRIRHRGNPAHSAIPIVAISGAHRSKGLQNALETAEKLGADFSLEKPFSPHDLLSIIDRLTASRAQA